MSRVPCRRRFPFVGLLVAGIICAACGGSSTSLSPTGAPAPGSSSGPEPPTAPTSPPPVAVLAVSPNSFGDPYAIAGQSRTHFDGSQSRGEGLRYVLEFGDGDTVNIPVADHVVSAAAEAGAARADFQQYSCGCGVLTPRLTVTDRYGRVDSVSATLPLLLLGPGIEFWAWGAVNPGVTTFALTFNLRQGSAVMGGLSSGVRFTGTLEGEREFRLTLANGEEYSGHFDYEWNGTRTHWGVPTRNRLVLRQTNGPNAGAEFILYVDQYA